MIRDDVAGRHRAGRGAARERGGERKPHQGWDCFHGERIPSRNAAENKLNLGFLVVRAEEKLTAFLELEAAIRVESDSFEI